MNTLSGTLLDARFHTHLTITDQGLPATAALRGQTLVYTLERRRPKTKAGRKTKRSRAEYRASGAEMTLTISCNAASFVQTFRRAAVQPAQAPQPTPF